MQPHICYGCMKVIAQEVCPHCGWSPSKNNLPHQLPVGTLLRGQFLVGKVLGQGGFGITYIGMDVKQNKVVAIKEYYPSFAVTRDVSQSNSIHLLHPRVQKDFLSGRERFLQESTLYARFQNIPEIVTIHSLFPDNNTSYIVIDYITGIDLRRYVSIKGGKLSAEETLTILKPIVRALNSVHKAGLVHRDITPDNIMILPDGGVKLLDFGAAHEICDPDPNAQIDHSTTAILKHGFAPPEQYKARGNLGPWTDEYGLCATIYYCLYGTVPPDAMDRMLSNSTISWEIPGLTQRQRLVLEKGMSLNLADRYGDLEVFGKELYDTTPEPEVITKPIDPDDNDPVHSDPPPYLRYIKIAAAALILVAGLALAVPKIIQSLQQNAQLNPVDPPEVTARPTDSETEDTFSETEETCVLLWEGHAYNAVFMELEYQISVHPDDSRYVDLMDYYQAELVNAVLTDARKYADKGNYPHAISTLDHYAKNPGRAELAEAAGEYRLEFGIRNTSYFAAGKNNSVLIKDNNTIVIVGEKDYGEADASDWTDISCVAAGDKHIVGLRSNGTVLTAGNNETGQRNTSGWTNVVAIAAGDYHTIALMEDGTLAAAGQLWAPRCDTEALQTKAGDKRIVAIAAGYLHTLALLEDGTVIATGENVDLQCEVESWKDIAAIYAGTRYSVGLKTDGSVVYAGNSSLDCSNWKNITNIAAGDFFILGLTEDGYLLSIGAEESIGPNTPAVISLWKNIVEIAAGTDHIIALTAEGKILCAGNNSHEQLHLEGLNITYPRPVPMP